MEQAGTVTLNYTNGLNENAGVDDACLSLRLTQIDPICTALSHLIGTNWCFKQKRICIISMYEKERIKNETAGLGKVKKLVKELVDNLAPLQQKQVCHDAHDWNPHEQSQQGIPADGHAEPSDPPCSERYE